MTEKLRVEDGRLLVERVEGKDSLDLDLSTVDEFYFEAAPAEGYSGALVLTDRDGKQHVVRVDNDDAADVVEQVRGPIANARDARREEAPSSDGPQPAVTDEPNEAPASTDEGTPTPVQRSRKSRQQS